jgi:hypothetical protein
VGPGDPLQEAAAPESLARRTLSPRPLGLGIGSEAKSGFLFACPFHAVSSTKTGKVFRREQTIGQAAGEKQNEGEVPSPLQASGLGSIIRTLIRNLSSSGIRPFLV